MHPGFSLVEKSSATLRPLCTRNKTSSFFAKLMLAIAPSDENLQAGTIVLIKKERP